MILQTVVVHYVISVVHNTSKVDFTIADRSDDTPLKAQYRQSILVQFISQKFCSLSYLSASVIRFAIV